MTIPTATRRAPTGAGRPARPGYRCTECGWTASKWVGRCGECQAWGSVVEDGGPGGTAPRTSVTTPTRNPARPIAEIDVEASRARPT